MSAVERTVHFAHALQHHDPLADPTRVSEDSNCLGQRRWSCKQTHAGDEGTSRALEVHCRVTFGSNMSGRQTDRAKAAGDAPAGASGGDVSPVPARARLNGF